MEPHVYNSNVLILSLPFKGHENIFFRVRNMLRKNSWRTSLADVIVDLTHDEFPGDTPRQETSPQSVEGISPVGRLFSPLLLCPMTRPGQGFSPPFNISGMCRIHVGDPPHLPPK